MRKAWFGPSLMAGMVIVVFAVIIDRMSGTLAQDNRRRYDPRVAGAILGFGIVASALSWNSLPDPSDYAMFDGVADYLDAGLSAFTAANGDWLAEFKNNAMFYGLLPLRIGLDQAVLPFTWGFQWTAQMSLGLFAFGAVLGVAIALRGQVTWGIMTLIFIGMLETGITNLPWPFVLIGAAALGWVSSGRGLAILSVGLLLTILLSGLWDRAMLSLYLSGAAVFACALIGGGIGLLCAVSPMAWRITRPICDMLQTIPSLALLAMLIPALGRIGIWPALVALFLYALLPIVRNACTGLQEVPAGMRDAALALGMRPLQVLWYVELPLSLPVLLAGIKTAAIISVGTATIAAFVGAGGYGERIVTGLALNDATQLLGGAIPAALLALVVQGGFGLAEYLRDRKRARMAKFG